MAEPAQRDRIEIKLPFEKCAQLQAEREQLDAQEQALWEDVANNMRRAMPEDLYSLFAVMGWLQSSKGLVAILKQIASSQQREHVVVLAAKQLHEMEFISLPRTQILLDQLETAWNQCLQIRFTEQVLENSETSEMQYTLTFSSR